MQRPAGVFWAATMADPMHVRAKRPTLRGSPADVYAAELGEARAYLDALRIHHLDLSERFLGQELYETDLFFTAAMARSYSLVDGFINAIDSWNPMVAAPLLRLQVDSLVRVAYLIRAPRVEDVAWHIIGGGEFRALTDSDGKKLTDRRLIEHAEQHHPWIDETYKATSGWIHFSPDHLRAVVQVTRDESSEEPSLHVSAAIPIRPEQIPLSALEELLAAMITATRELFGYVELWEATKEAKRAMSAQA
jgi:hypothetical protein